MAKDEDDIFSAFGLFDDEPKGKSKRKQAAKKAEPLPELKVEPETPEARRFIPTLPGRQDAAPYSLQKLAKDYTEEALEMVLHIMRFAEDDSTRLEAAKHVLDRGWGKPSLKVQAETIKYTLQDVEAKLLEHKAEVDVKVLEARKQNEQLLRYLVTDAEVISDTSACSESTL